MIMIMIMINLLGKTAGWYGPEGYIHKWLYN